MASPIIGLLAIGTHPDRIKSQPPASGTEHHHELPIEGTLSRDTVPSPLPLSPDVGLAALMVLGRTNAHVHECDSECLIVCGSECVFVHGGWLYFLLCDVIGKATETSKETQTHPQTSLQNTHTHRKKGTQGTHLTTASFAILTRHQENERDPEGGLQAC